MDRLRANDGLDTIKEKHFEQIYEFKSSILSVEHYAVISTVASFILAKDA